MATFELFRYQLLPASQVVQQSLFHEVLTIDELKAIKNELFNDALGELSLAAGDEGLREMRVLHSDQWYVAKVAPRRKAVLNRPDFRTEQVEDWPHVSLFIDNDPDVQVVGVSRNPRAFQNPHSVVRKLEKRLLQPLKQRGLTVQFQSIYDQQEFWQLIEVNRGKVERVRFEMIAPNMANLSRVLRVDIKRLNQEANAQKTTLELEAVAGTALEIDRQDELISGCVDYSAEGGGDIKVKLRGVKKEIRTSTSVRTLEVDEMIFETSTPEGLRLMLQSVLK